MIRTLTIGNFRAFRKLQLTGLSRVNLLVGSNNSGKTSVLEALQFLALGGDIRALTTSLSRRAELSVVSRDQRANASALDVRYLFHQRCLEGDPFTVGADTRDDRRIEFSVSAPRVPIADEEQVALWRRQLSRSIRFRRERPPRTDDDFVDGERVPRFLEVRSGQEIVGRAPLQFGGTLDDDEEMLVGSPKSTTPVQFIGTAPIGQGSLARLYDRVVLTDEEPGVVLALNIVEDSIVKVAAVEREARGYHSRGVIVGLRGGGEPVPLGSLGDGMSRMLAIALSLVAARDGFLLVDEIDTGLHHTVMRKMWKLVFETASRLNVCVFATTHSYDCVHALAAIVDPAGQGAGNVSLIRVDRDRSEGVHFSEREISILAEREIEPR